MDGWMDRCRCRTYLGPAARDGQKRVGWIEAAVLKIHRPAESSMLGAWQQGLARPGDTVAKKVCALLTFALNIVHYHCTAQLQAAQPTVFTATIADANGEE